jgi:hypothetical protein
MKKISKAEIKKAILAMEAERLKHPVEFRPNPQQHRRLDKNRREYEKMMLGFLSEAGLDMEKLRALQEQHGVELDRLVAKHKTDALRRASRKNTPHSSILAQSEALGDVASRDDVFLYPSFTLDTPLLIWPTPLLAVDSEGVPFGSWAKFRIKTSDDHQRAYKVSFYFYWMSPFSDYAVIDAATSMSATGHLKAHASWGGKCRVEASAQFGIWFGFQRAVESTSYKSESLGFIAAVSGLILPDSDARAISDSVDFGKPLFVVPPQSPVIFEVALAVNYINDGGSIEADFESGDFKIACPVVVFHLLNSPPMG